MKSIRTWLRAERGFGTAGMFILMLPVIVGIFGYGFESARAVWLKNYIQGRADMATFTATTHSTVTTSGKIVFKADAVPTAYSEYLANTDTKRSDGLLICSGSSVTNGTLGPSGSCFGKAWIVAPAKGSPSFCGTNSSANRYGIHYRLEEQVPATFLHIVGIQTLTLPVIDSETLLRAKDC